MHFFANIAYASVDSFVMNVNRLIINPIIAFLFALALAYFLYGMFQFVSNGENDEKRTIGKTHMIYGLIGITIMMGVWFIMNVILDTFNIKNINPEDGTVQLDDYTPRPK